MIDRYINEHLLWIDYPLKVAHGCIKYPEIRMDNWQECLSAKRTETKWDKCIYTNILRTEEKYTNKYIFLCILVHYWLFTYTLKSNTHKKRFHANLITLSKH